MITPSLREKMATLFHLWGPASLSYAMLSAAQIAIASSMSQSSSAGLMIALALVGILSFFIHKGKTFDEVRARAGKSVLQLPWSFKTTHLSVCVGMIILSSAMPSSGLLRIPELSYLSAAFSVLAGWLASMVPGPGKETAKS